MRSAAVRRGPIAAGLALLVGAASAVLLPASDGPFAAGLLAAVLVVVVAVAAGSIVVVPAGRQPGTRARAVLVRLVPRAAQSDPDARGHARPRAPGAPLPAV